MCFTEVTICVTLRVPGQKYDKFADGRRELPRYASREALLQR